MESENWDFRTIAIRENLCEPCQERLASAFKDPEDAQLEDPQGDPLECGLCSGLFQEVSNFVDIILEASSEHEFTTFLVGLVLDQDILDHEGDIHKEILEKSGVAV